MSEYLNLLLDCKNTEAQALRKSLIPDKLRKWISLSDDKDSNEYRFDTLQNNMIWFTSAKNTDDTYDFRGFYFSQDALRSMDGYTEQIGEALGSGMDMMLDRLLLVSLSANTPSNLPMWSQYANNSRGFCVEYTVTSPNNIYPIEYYDERIPIAKAYILFLASGLWAKDEFTTEGKHILSNIVAYQTTMKHSSWKYQSEYRIVLPDSTNRDEVSKGMNKALSSVGLRINKIFAGIMCEKTNLDRLNTIARSLGLPGIYRMTTHRTNYVLQEEYYE